MNNHTPSLIRALRFFIGLIIVSMVGICQAQQAPQPVTQGQAAADATTTDYAITQVGPDSVVWRNSAGQTVTSIATGMNYSTDGGQTWLPSDNSFAISPDGNSFVADKLRDPTTIAANINVQGAVTAITPEGVTMSSTPTAIVLYDAASGLSAIVGTITNSIGVQVDAQHVVFTNAFSSTLFSASIVYSLPDPGSFHQDVIFTGFNRNFDPTAYGFAADATNTLQIELLTEFYNAPQPMAQQRDLYIEQDPNVRASMASPDFIDYTLDFGHYVFGPGRAYTTSSLSGAGGGVAVAKDFVNTNGRTFLVESLKYQSIASYLQSLPPTKTTASLNPPPAARKRMVAWEGIPSLERKGPRAKAMKVAGLTPRGLDVDYIAVVSSTVEPKLYSSDTTYFVTNTVYLTAPVTIESAVFKFPTNQGAIEIASTLTLATTNYRTAIFTSADDSSAGATLSTSVWAGYTGNNQNHLYGKTGLWLATTANVTLNNLRFCYLTTALELDSDGFQQTFNLWHIQMVDCNEGIYLNGANVTNSAANLYLYNCLMASIGTEFQMGQINVTNGAAYNCTVDNCTNLMSVDTASTGGLKFTNSIISSLGSKGTLHSQTLGGANNVFYNCGSATFGSFNTISSSPYVTNGAGYYYITNYISYLTNGSTSIPAALLSQLERKTTQAPCSIISIPFSTILTPIIPRDLTGVALGWHYDPIDFMFNHLDIPTNTTLVLTNGVAMAYVGPHGIVALDGSTLYCQGTPNQRNYLAYYNLIQEQPLSLAAFSLSGTTPILLDPTNTAPSVTLRLTTICAPTGATTLLNTGPNLTFASLIMRDCEVYGSGGIWQMTDTNSSPAPIMQLVNNVFYRVPFAITNAATNIVFNNLFYGTTNTNEFAISIQHLTTPSPNTNQNNVYDGVTAALDGSTGYNAYLHGAVATLGGVSSDLTNSSLAWQAGPLGAYYQQSGGPLWENGGESAANLGLYHYTVLTSEAIEGSSTVSRGYHYVALTNTTGLPLDYNNDGVPDYLEDANGDGSTDNGETNWMSNTPAWIGTSPFSQNALVGASVTFSVSAYGTAPLTYQWYSNSVSLGSGATSSSYTISSVTTSDAATYYVTAANSYGSATSSSATLTIVTAPFLYSTYPVFTGQFWFQPTWDYLISWIGIYGSATPTYYSQYLTQYLPYISSYQWQLNGANITGASGSAVQFTYNTATNDGGTNTLVVTNVAGSSSLSWTNIVQATPGMVETWGNNAEGQCSRPLWLTNAAGIAAGAYQSIAVTVTNSIVQWGEYYSKPNFYSVSNSSVATLPPTNGVVAVAVGAEQGLALMTNGTVYSWGLTNDEFGVNWSIQPHLSNVTAIACGYGFDLALSNGTVIAWGENNEGELNVPAYLTNVVAISAGLTHALALRTDGTIVSWGTQGGSTNVPVLTNAVAIAAGGSHNLVLQSNGFVLAWGDNTDNQCNVPPAIQGNVVAIATGDYFSMALLYNGTVVEWGDNTYWQTNVPQSDPNQPVVLKYIAAGGTHSMAAIWSPSQQYPVNASRDVLLVYTIQSALSTNVFNYYRTNRPLATNFNTLGINCPAGEGISWYNYTNSFVAPIVTWLNSNQMKWPKYVILFPDLPSILTNAAVTATCSVQYDMNSGANAAFGTINNYAPGWHPYVTAINMNGLNGSNDCFAYINKLTNMAAGRQTLFISASSNGYGNENWYFDDANAIHPYTPGLYAEDGIESNGVPSIDIFYNPTTSTINFSRGTNVAAYYSWGWDTGGHLLAGYATNGQVVFTNASTWSLAGTVESFNGQRNNGFQGTFLNWFATNAFMGTNSTLPAYTNTPVGAISHVYEPQEFADNTFDYFGLWAAGRPFAICAWAAQTGTYANYANLYGYANDQSDWWFQATGDPFVMK